MTRILIADDMTEIVRLLTRTLEAEGYEVLAAGNGKQACEVAAREIPDVIILDIMMPEMDGIAACRRIKTDPRLQSVPVLMLTAKATEDDVVRALEAGADDYVTKPFEPRVLKARVTAAVRMRLSQERLAQLGRELQTETVVRKRLEAELTRTQRANWAGVPSSPLADRLTEATDRIGDHLQFLRDGFRVLKGMLPPASGTASAGPPTAGHVVHEIPRTLDDCQAALDTIAEIARTLGQSKETLHATTSVSRAAHSCSPAL